MGCGCSKPDAHDGGDEYGHGRTSSAYAQKYSERTPLLADGPSIQTSNVDYERVTLDHAREQEKLNAIVQRTAENLIEISGQMPTRLYEQDALERANAYRNLLQGVQLNRAKLLAPFSLPIGPSGNVMDILAAGSVTKEDIEFMRETSAQILEAFREMKVQDVGPIVVPLPDVLNLYS